MNPETSAGFGYPSPAVEQRGLGIPNVMDRWVQEAVRRVLEPIFEPTFHTSSHGFRPGRGAPTAIAEAKRYVEEGRGIVVDLDLSKFFDRVNWQRLLARLAQRIKDKRVLKLIHRMLKAKVVMPEGTKVVGHGRHPPRRTALAALVQYCLGRVGLGVGETRVTLCEVCR